MSDRTLEDQQSKHWNVANDHAHEAAQQEPSEEATPSGRVSSLKAALRAAQLQVIRDELVTLGYAAPRQVMACYGLTQGLPVLLELQVDGKPCPTFLGSDAADELGFLLLWDFDPDAEDGQLTYDLVDAAAELPF